MEFLIIFNLDFCEFHTIAHLLAQFFEEDFIEIDQPCVTEEFLILQQLDPSRRKESYTNMLANLNSLFLMLVVLFFVVVCVGLHVLKANQSKGPPDPRLASRKLSTGWRTLLSVKWSFVYTASAIGIFLLCYDLHLFLTRLFFSNNIQVEKTVCDTSNIILNAQDLLTTEKVMD